MAVTYCPLCNSGVAFERTVEGEATTFGVSGFLYADNLVMFDRATESLWPQLRESRPWACAPASRWRASPSARSAGTSSARRTPTRCVLNRNTGFERDYGTQPLPRLRRTRLAASLPAAG